MHDKHGRAIKVGDCIRVKVWNQGDYVSQFATVTATYPGQTSCNVMATTVVSSPAVVHSSYNADETEVVARGDGSPLQ